MFHLDENNQFYAYILRFSVASYEFMYEMRPTVLRAVSFLLFGRRQCARCCCQDRNTDVIVLRVDPILSNDNSDRSEHYCMGENENALSSAGKKTDIYDLFKH